MFAIAFDLVVADTAQHHPKGVAQAYADIGSTLAGFGFNRVQGSLYTTPSEDLANLFGAITALKALPSLRPSRHSRFPCRAMVGFHQTGEGVGPAATSRSRASPRKPNPSATRPAPATRNHMPSLDMELAAGGRVAGVDEAGRGPLAGPVVAAAVVLPRRRAARLAVCWTIRRS